MPATNVKVVVNKDTTDKFARKSPTLNHIYKYPAVATTLDRLVSLPIVSQMLSLLVLSALKTKEVVVDSAHTPRAVKVGYNAVGHGVLKIDEVINLLVFREGIDAFVRCLHTHSDKLGIWVLYFCIDYIANVSNMLLTQLVVKPLQLSLKEKTLKEVVEESTKSDEGADDSLTHVSELTSTTKRISKDIQEKIQSGYIEPTAEFAKSKYDSLVKPTTEKLQSEYVGPTTDFAKQKYDSYVKPTADRLQAEYIEPTKAQLDTSYKTVSATFENNLSKSESVPRAILSTGRDLKNLTLENLKANKSELDKDVKAATESAKKAANEKLADLKNEAN
ncbi:hypothetical protein HG535_0H00690 [Zygotorulaspora mrakii]|uniref:Uncharacterized protein n=1 Tax=Zygotorulaspora mrakii TaxID=42260 RepID=A0A7H9B920_ZYGMR|nr:uncharacterized protein HG535_0H00690 [Zygotorulaspora mrakii]QLG74744.1 hypothetical protein HG535_0H00690 [Zygotorulaspora mrakii]